MISLALRYLCSRKARDNTGGYFIFLDQIIEVKFYNFRHDVDRQHWGSGFFDEIVPQRLIRERLSGKVEICKKKNTHTTDSNNFLKVFFPKKRIFYLLFFFLKTQMNVLVHTHLGAGEEARKGFEMYLRVAYAQVLERTACSATPQVRGMGGGWEGLRNTEKKVFKDDPKPLVLSHLNKESEVIDAPPADPRCQLDESTKRERIE